MNDERLISKADLLEKLRAYTETPDDESIQYKEKIKKALLQNPCLLYALNNKNLEPEIKMVTLIGNITNRQKNMNRWVNGTDILENLPTSVLIFSFLKLRQKLRTSFAIR